VTAGNRTGQRQQQLERCPCIPRHKLSKQRWHDIFSCNSLCWMTTYSPTSDESQKAVQWVWKSVKASITLTSNIQMEPVMH
jgi:hypothetical protein